MGVLSSVLSSEIVALRLSSLQVPRPVCIRPLNVASRTSKLYRESYNPWTGNNYRYFDGHRSGNSRLGKEVSVRQEVGILTLST